jgi:hypothetical protein
MDHWCPKCEENKIDCKCEVKRMPEESVESLKKLIDRFEELAKGALEEAGMGEHYPAPTKQGKYQPDEILASPWEKCPYYMFYEGADKKVEIFCAIDGCYPSPPCKKEDCLLVRIYLK